MLFDVSDFVIDQKQTDLFTSFKWRNIYLVVLVLLSFSFLIVSLFELQIVNGRESLIQATNISQDTNIVRASRGVIYDRNGKVLARNVASFSVALDASLLEQTDRDKIVGSLAGVLDMSEVELEQVFDQTMEDSSNVQVNTVATGLSLDQYLEVVQLANSTDGIIVQEGTVRNYNYKESVAHILGYVSDINLSEMEEAGLDANSQIGKDGIEKQYDQVLRGEDGKEVQKISLSEGKLKDIVVQTPEDGSNLYLTIDIDWQEKLFELVERYTKESDAFAGVAIILDSDTGEVVSMVNYPSYDNNLFAGGISSTIFNELVTDSSTPLLNRSIAQQLPMGSTFKPVVASAALQEGVIDSSTRFKSGCVELPLYKLCEADYRYLGTMTVVEGIGKSSNVFFCKTGLEMTEKARGIRTLIEYTGQYGIGQKTGIDLPGEQEGSMASPEFKEEVLKEPWYLADICNTVIGQGLVTATPIQMGVVASIISNDGVVYRPHILKRIVDQQGGLVEQIEPVELRRVGVDYGHFETIKEGMDYAVNGYQGSATGLKGLPGNPYAKTGSAEAVEYRDGKKVEGAHSWAIGGFDYGGDNYSFVLHLQEGGRGYKALPIIRDFIQWLYS